MPDSKSPISPCLPHFRYYERRSLPVVANDHMLQPTGYGFVYSRISLFVPSIQTYSIPSKCLETYLVSRNFNSLPIRLWAMQKRVLAGQMTDPKTFINGTTTRQALPFNLPNSRIHAYAQIKLQRGPSSRIDLLPDLREDGSRTSGIVSTTSSRLYSRFCLLLFGRRSVMHSPIVQSPPT